MRAFPRFLPWPLAACLALSAVIWVATELAVRSARRSTEAEAAATRRNLANALAEHEASSMRAIDISLTYLRESWKRDPRGFDEDVARFEALLRRERVIQVAVVDAQGDLLYSRLPRTERPNFSDREYFQALKASERDELHVSEPVFGRVTGQWAIQVARPLRDAQDRFAGLLVVAIPPPALENDFRGIDLGERGVITLVRADGQILARSADFPRSVNVSLPGAARASGREGEFTSRGTVDGVPRFFSYRAVEPYALVVLVGQAVDTVMAPYVKQRNTLYAFAAGATLFLLCIAVLLCLRGRDRARFEAARERLMLELHDGCIQSIYAIGLNLQRSRGLLHSATEQAGRLIAQAEADLNLVIQELRAFMSGEAPAALPPGQLRAEIERSLPRTPGTGFAVDLDDAALGALDTSEAAEILRIVREAAANVARHSGATQARISLRRPDGAFELDIVDNGRGIPAQPTASGLGLAHIAARARKLRGTAEIGPKEGGGTRVRVRFPVTP